MGGTFNFKSLSCSIVGWGAPFTKTHHFDRDPWFNFKKMQNIEQT